ncbi:DUF6600 domain-containing protein [Burkholderia stagnalis]|uniref:DUF6600 domain-containing protein n=1 Tax=Burkholderia stagnalis TaxID=1503054 RepID=UPI000756552A|nr:DUF6600 domain-containing protein [Burkholderia stagnalis]KVC65447.1 hypothetical protein WS59_01105 [Burkholderia stagnalis]KVN21280.1 hypothetical protein WT10_12840 [Burkholderia stagnalis]KWI78051.1 hypothetical protein WT75_02360 [Burkholderia stagnalis]KWK70071.1 hypothetical protein WT82_14270 [Burkholderia stagnalis]KWN23436.1 hypothetical protein WT85_02920 [Burkholderia stagnalis]
MALQFTLTRTARLTLLAFAALAALPPAFAQSAAAAPYAAAARQPGGDPPGRVARLNYLSGAVTTEPAGTDTWSYAAVNRPLTTGDQLWNDAGARSELHIGSSAVRLGESTSLSVMNLDDTTTQLKVGLGTVSTHVRALPPGTSYEIDTPNLALGIAGPGDYRVDVAPNGASTTVTVRRGSATVYGDTGQYPLSAGQQVVFTGTGLQVAQQAGAPAYDPLDQWAANRDAAEDRSVSARYVSRDIPGYQDLDANGTWRDNPSYGAMWVPNDTPADWAPYRDGHWIWQAPWGWTWVDDAPWGFAPYHYGRWAYVDDSWAWVPGPVVVSEPPVYAPALVAFVGGGGGRGGFDWSVGLAVGGAAAAGCAWFPLGPGERWHPGWGGWSPRYYDRVNQHIVVNNVNVNKTVNVTNITNINNTYVNFRAPHAITAVPATAFVHGQPVAHFSQHVDPQQWRNAHVTPGTPGIAPVRQSFTGGLRNAAYHPPAALGQRPVIATRNPAVPPAYRDQAAAHLVQQGARVPGAGAPVVKTAVPPDYTPHPVRVPGNPHAGGWAMHNVQLVNPHGPVVQPAREGQPGQVRAGAGVPANGRPGSGEVPDASRLMNGVAPNASHVPNGEAPNASRFMNGAPPNAPRPLNGEAPNAPHFANGAAPNAPRSMNGGDQNAARVTNGVPHPPSFDNAPGAHGDNRLVAAQSPSPSPAWMQPHAPLDRQHAGFAPSGAPTATHPAGQNALPPVRSATPAPAPHPDAANAEQPPRGTPSPRALPNPRTDMTAQAPQPRPDFVPPAQHGQSRPDNAAPAPRPHADYAPPAPRHDVAPPYVNDYRPPAPARETPRPQPAPHMEPRPQMPAPHMEPRPQMQPPRMEPRPQMQPPHVEQPRPQPQPPRMEPRPSMPAPHVESHPPPQAPHDNGHDNRHHQ